MLVILVYSEPNDMYFLLAVTVQDAKFTLIDQFKFKRGHTVHNFELMDLGQY